MIAVSDQAARRQLKRALGPVPIQGSHSICMNQGSQMGFLNTSTFIFWLQRIPPAPEGLDLGFLKSLSNLPVDKVCFAELFRIRQDLLKILIFLGPWGFSRQEYWSGLLCPPPGGLPDPGIKAVSPVSSALQVDSLPIEPSRNWESSSVNQK